MRYCGSLMGGVSLGYSGSRKELHTAKDANRSALSRRATACLRKFESYLEMSLSRQAVQAKPLSS